MPKWRNGRRKGLKILRWKHHAGSSPALGTRCDGFIRLFLLRRRSFLFRRPSPGAAMRQNYNRGRFFQTAKNRQTSQFYPKKKYELPSNEKFVFFYRIFDLINLLINEFISRRQKKSVIIRHTTGRLLLIRQTNRFRLSGRFQRDEL